MGHTTVAFAHRGPDLFHSGAATVESYTGIKVRTIPHVFKSIGNVRYRLECESWRALTYFVACFLDEIEGS